jgi:hypothetical protein
VPIGAPRVAMPNLAKNIEFFKQGQNQANGCSTCSYWSSHREDIFLSKLEENS